MDGPTGILIKLGVRLLVFGAVFFIVARRNPKVAVHARWAYPLVALVFAALNTGLYWALKPVFDLATLGVLGFFMPLIVNVVLLFATVRFFAWEKLPRVLVRPAADPKAKPVARPLFEIRGIVTMLTVAVILTLAHGALWVALDYLPNR